MMTIDTGVNATTVVEPQQAGIHFTDGVLLPAAAGVLEPGEFTVFDGGTAVLTAYGLTGTQKLEIEKMLYVSGSAGSAGSCSCPATVGTIPARVNAVTLCDWELSECKAIKAINIPGRYRVVDPLQLSSDNVIVTITYVEKNTVPTALLYGGL